MKRTKSWLRICVSVAGIAAITLSASNAYAEEAPELAHLVQNPVAKVISLPFQNNLNFGAGPQSDEQDVLNIQPVLPFDIGPNHQLQLPAGLVPDELPDHHRELESAGQ